MKIRSYLARLNVGARNRRGQAICEAAAVLVVIIPLLIGLALLVLNVGFAVMNQQKVNVVAAETAKVVATQRYYLGAEVPAFKARREEIESKAQVVCDAMLKHMGLPPGKIAITYSDVEGTATSVVGCTVKVDRIPMFGAGIFPSLIALTGQGVASQDPGLGMGNTGNFLLTRLALDHTDANGSHRWIFYIPVYNVEKENVSPGGGIIAGTQATPCWPAYRTEYVASTYAKNWENGGFWQQSAKPGSPHYGKGGY
jgi:hypothetical protein